MSQSSLAGMTLPAKAKYVSTHISSVISGVYQNDSRFLKESLRARVLLLPSICFLALAILNIAFFNGFQIWSIFVLVLATAGPLYVFISLYSDYALDAISKRLESLTEPITSKEWEKERKSGFHTGRELDLYRHSESSRKPEFNYAQGIRVSQENYISIDKAISSLANLSGEIVIAKELRYDPVEDVYRKNIFKTSFKNGVFVETEVYTGPRYAIRQAVKNI